MIAIAAVLQFAGLAYSPAFLFPGEAARITPMKQGQRSSISFHSVQGGSIRETREGWILTARVPTRARATFLFDVEGDGLPEDGTVVEVPIALGPAHALLRTVPGVYGGIAVTNCGERRVAVVPTTAGSALLVEARGKQLRFAPMLEAEVAVRTAPKRLRSLHASYAFASASGITLLGRPGAIAAVSIRVGADGIRARYVALFHQTGTLRLLGSERKVTLLPTEEVEMFVSFTSLGMT